MKPLYEIANEYLTFLNQVSDLDEITDEHMDLLDHYQDTLANKVLNIGSFIKNLEIEYEAIEKAIDSMSERSFKINKKLERLKDYVKFNMDKFNLKEVKNPYLDIKVRLNPPSIIIKDEKLIPNKYIKEQILSKIDKALICQDLKNNMIVPGVILEQKTRLEIK